ncbi:MAG TPA: aminotransferase class V-fold PLP-dependent enzyme [Gaiellaceae bacterium]
MNLDAIRAEIPVLERKAYLNTGTFGPLPRRSGEEVERWQRRSVEEGRAGHAFFEAAQELRAALRSRIGGLIGAPEGSVALLGSTTEGCDVVAGGLGLGPGDEAVTTDVEHPGLFGALRVSGATVRVAEVRDRPAGEALDAIRAEITGRTRLVALSHVAWTTGAVLPIDELASDGVPVLVDGAQSAGAIPVDVSELGCDFYTVSGQKWLLGPDATGALYVRPDWTERLELTAPSFLSWEDFAEWTPWPDARRFESSWIPPGSLAGLLASLDFAESAGHERFARARSMADMCRERLAERVEIVTEPGQGTLVSFRPEGDAGEVVERLAENDVIVRALPGVNWVRASCGFWTSEDEVERLAVGLG